MSCFARESCSIVPDLMYLLWPTPIHQRAVVFVRYGLIAAKMVPTPNSASGLPSNFVKKGLLLLRSGYVRELASASYPHIHCGGADFPFVAGGVCGERRLS